MTENVQHRELEDMKTEMASLRQDVAAIVDSVRKLATANNGRGGSRRKKKAVDEETWEDIQAKLDELQSQSKKSVGEVQEQIMKHPLGSILTAFGIGFMISKAMDLGGRR